MISEIQTSDVYRALTLHAGFRQRGGREGSSRNEMGMCYDNAKPEN